jgi:hypothetical protein
MIRRFTHLSAVLLVLAMPAAAGEHSEAGSVVAPHPADRWELTLESGYLWNIGNNTPID